MALLVDDLARAADGNAGDASEGPPAHRGDASVTDAGKQLSAVKVDLVLDDDEGFLGYIC